MRNHIDRRQFLKRCSVRSLGILVSPNLTGMLAGQWSDGSPEHTVSVVAGDRYFENTIKAIEALGGMKRFVKKGALVALLINSVFDRPGSVVHTDIPLAVLKMCLDAGAGRVLTIENTPRIFWKMGTMSEKFTKEINGIGYSSDKKNVNLPGAVYLKQGSVSSSLIACDVFINIPIIKDHKGTQYTGNLKNMMGAFSSATCRRCHYGDQSLLTQIFQGAYEKVELLTQSIADLNLVRTPDLSVADVTEILATNGPVGPGKIIRPMEIVAGTNALAVDMYCVKHLGLNVEETVTIRHAQEHHLGPKSLAEVKVLWN
ncbi:MAG: DUF362 domain-containing protein [bacterium]